MDPKNFDHFQCPSNGYTKVRPASAAERARVVFNHVRATSSHSNLTNRMTCDGDHQIKDGYMCASGDDSQQCNDQVKISSSDKKIHPQLEESKRGLDKKKPTNWLDVLKIDPKLYWPKKYRYTVEPIPGAYFALTVQQREFYEDNGYIVLKKILPKNLLVKLKTMKFNNPHSNSLVDINMACKNECVKEFMAIPDLIKLIECFCGHNIMSMSCLPIFDHNYPLNDTENYKRDMHCMPFRPADRIVCLWVALDSFDSAKEPGFGLVPGSHRSGYLDSSCSDEEGNQHRVIYERIKDIESLIKSSNGESRKKSIQLNPGDILFYHPLLVYNVQLRSRDRLVALNAKYASSECQYVTINGLRNDFRSEIPSSFASLVSENQDGLVINKSVWQNQGILIKGKKIHL